MTYNGQLKLTWNVHLNLTWNEIHTCNWLDMKCTPAMDSMKCYTPKIDIWHEMDTMDMKYTAEIDMILNVHLKWTWWNIIHLKLKWHEMDTGNWHEICTWNWEDMRLTPELNVRKCKPKIGITWNVHLILTQHEMDSWNWHEVHIASCPFPVYISSYQFQTNKRTTNKRMNFYWTVWEATLHIIGINKLNVSYAHHTSLCLTFHYKWYSVNIM